MKHITLTILEPRRIIFGEWNFMDVAIEHFSMIDPIPVLKLESRQRPTY